MAPASVQGTSWPPSVPPGQKQWGGCKVKAHCHSKDLGWTEITHPFHPLRGQRFRILKTRSVGSIETLVLEGSYLGTFSVSKEWTNKAPPSLDTDHQENLPILDFKSLVDLKTVVVHLGYILRKGVDNAKK